MAPCPPRLTVPLLVEILTPAAALVVTLASTLVTEDEPTVRLDNGALPPTSPRKVTAPTPPVTLRLREVPSELIVESNRMSPEVAPLETTRFAVSITGFFNSIKPPRPCVAVPCGVPPMAFKSPFSVMIPAGAPIMMLPALPPLRFEVAPLVAAPPVVVIAPTARLPVVLVRVTAAALLPTPTELLAPVVIIFCRVTPLAAVTVTEPEAVPVSVPAVVVILAPEMAVTAPEVAVRLMLPPLVTSGSLMVMDDPVMVTIPLACPPAAALPVITLPPLESKVSAPVELLPRVMAPPALTAAKLMEPVS